jgi:CRP-like cAMP-binding protein
MYAPSFKRRTIYMTPRIAAAPFSPGNLLLAGLPTIERRRLIARCEPVELGFEQILCEAGDRIRHVYFPTASFISIIASVDKSSYLEVGLVGTEGMLHSSFLFGVQVASLRALVQGAGPALRMDTAQFSLELERSAVLRKRLNSYLYVLVTQLSQMAPCARFHLVEARLARWLLMTRDRAHSNRFRLTQDFLAFMLGVRRAGITRAASNLQERKLIRYRRGEMQILDATGLEAVSCECYAAAEQVYARFMGRRKPSAVRRKNREAGSVPREKRFDGAPQAFVS